MKNHFKSQIKSLNRTIKLLNYSLTDKMLLDCVNSVNNGRKIIATALGKNVPICEKFIGTLTSLGVKANFMHTNSAVHGDLGIISQGDVVIILSKSGNTSESVYLYKYLNKLNCKIWLLTCNKNSKLSKVVKNKIVLEIANEGDPWNLVPNNSSLAFLFFLQAISMSLIEKNKIGIDVFKRNHPGGDIGRILGLEKK